MSSKLPSLGDKDGIHKIAAMGMGTPLPMVNRLSDMGGGKGPAWLNPADYFNGKLQGELTGDTSKDMRYGLARYGLFAAPWMPALAYESQKKGDDINKQNEAAAVAAAQNAQFNSASPYQRNVQFQGNNPFLGGQFNQLADLLRGQAGMGNLGGLL